VTVVLVTGATGFIGSALAAALLARGQAVVAPSRRDPDGARTRDAVARAARGFQLDLTPSDWERLAPVAVEGGLRPEHVEACAAVWHCAAEMSFATKKVLESYEQNVAATTRLYELVRDRARACRRFHHVSTAYLAGMDGGRVPAELLYHPRLANTYQLTKWSAEHALANLSRGGLPVTLFRPTGVIGHRTTGWSAGRSHGWFLFVRAIHAAARRGVAEVTFDVDRHARFDGIPIDDVVRAALAFTFRAEDPAGLEIVHCGNPHQLTIEEHFGLIGEVLGVRIAYGPPVTPFDRELDAAVSVQREFASRTWTFDYGSLQRVVDVASCGRPLDRAELVAMIRAHVAHLDQAGPA
jgi:nucleoside-diphosphate-sugar epimerase